MPTVTVPKPEAGPPSTFSSPKTQNHLPAPRNIRSATLKNFGACFRSFSFDVQLLQFCVFAAARGGVYVEVERKRGREEEDGSGRLKCNVGKY